MTTSREALARLLWAEIAGSGQRQCDIAAIVGITEKHLSQTINGRTGMSLDLVDEVLRACGRRLVLATDLITDPITAEVYAEFFPERDDDGRPI